LGDTPIANGSGDGNGTLDPTASEQKKRVHARRLTSDAVEDRQGGKRHKGRREQDPDVGPVQSEVDERMRLKDALWFSQTSAI
jgi:hypothetical protein